MKQNHVTHLRVVECDPTGAVVMMEAEGSDETTFAVPPRMRVLNQTFQFKTIDAGMVSDDPAGIGRRSKLIYEARVATTGGTNFEKLARLNTVVQLFHNGEIRQTVIVTAYQEYQIGQGVEDVVDKMREGTNLPHDYKFHEQPAAEGYSIVVSRPNLQVAS